jgi:outer membrane receptor for ferrienterochelin and colicin
MSSAQTYPYFATVRVGSGISAKNYLYYQATAGQLQDQPKATYNAILGWDYKGFSSRFSFRYQEVTLTNLDTQYPMRNAYYDNVLLVDISVKQNIIYNLSIFANVTNINNHIDNYYLSYYNGNDGSSGHLPTSQQTYGMQAQLGVSFNY